jgi:potassium efflux system protein
MSHRFIKPMLLMFIFFLSEPLLAQNSYINIGSDADKLVQYLSQEKVELIRQNTQSQLPKEPENREQLQVATKQNEALLILIHAKIASLEGFLAEQRQQQRWLAFKIKKYTLSNAQKSNDPQLQTQLSQLGKVSDVNTKTINLISDNLVLAHRYEMSLLATKRQLLEWDAKQQGIQHLLYLQKKIEVLRQERSQFYEKNIALQQTKNIQSDFNKTYFDELQQQLNNQHIVFIHQKMAELQLRIKLVKANEQLTQSPDIKSIFASIDLYKNVLDELNGIENEMLMLLDLLKEEQSHAFDALLKQRIEALKTQTMQFLSQVKMFEKQLNEQLDLKQQDLKKQLSVRQTLAGYQGGNWMSVKTESTQLPLLVMGRINGSLSKILTAYESQEKWIKISLWLSLAAIILLTIFLSHKFSFMTQEKGRSRLSAHLYDGVLILLARNLWQIAALSLFFTALFLIDIPWSAHPLLINLLLVWFVFRNFIIVAKMILIERSLDVSGKDERLFYRLRWLLIAGGMVTALMVFSQQLPMSMLVQDIFTRLFMLFMFALSLTLWANKDMFPLLLRPVLKAKKKYLRKAVSLLFVLLPITLFTTAMIGLIGYMNLAWSMSRYQAYVVMVMIGYVLARGLLTDLLELISEWMIASLRNGWLWVEVMLKPFEHIFHIVLFSASVIFLFQLFGVYTEMPVLTWLRHWGRYEIIDVSGVHITLVSVLEFIIVVSIFVWAAKWTREFCYRWLYRDSRDEGVRNSLSVFTQYAVILIGGYITLRVLGLDFSGMSMIIGGLAVGMGFGLRDFASNIVGGIMLLIERPVREGDLITLGDHEGRVSHIGIRSMRLSSWDNTEVLIPNAETFNKPFINWTHQDSVVRTAVPIKVSRDDDPVLVQSLIFEVLAIIPEILSEPPYQVLLKQIDDALINFEVRYFIDIKYHTRFEVRSKFLFALMAQFKAVGIKEPIPPMSIEIKPTKNN